MYAVIMAGGGGTRLWPLSRVARPKPFLPLLEGGRSLLEATVERLTPLLDPTDIFVVTDARYEPLVRATVPSLPMANVIAEPMPRNTAAAVALAAHAIARAGDEVMLVMPADQVVRDADGLRDALRAAVARAAGGDLVTLGVEPTFPATGYGYVIATGEPSEAGGRAMFRVERFEEKPAPARAQELVDSGSAYWNAGTFVWRRDALIATLDRHAPELSGPIREGLAEVGSPDDAGPWPGERLSSVYEPLLATSIDYAVMEPASAEALVAVVPMSVGWDDLGSWSALKALRTPAGSTGNMLDASGDAAVLEVGSDRVFVHATGGRVVALVGVSDLVVVDTPDALLVCAPEAAQDVKAIVDRLKADRRTDLL